MSRKESKDGTFSPHISKELTSRINLHYAATSENRTQFVEDAIKKYLDAVERETLNKLSKDELINMILEKED